MFRALARSHTFESQRRLHLPNSGSHRYSITSSNLTTVLSYAIVFNLVQQLILRTIQLPIIKALQPLHSNPLLFKPEGRKGQLCRLLDPNPHFSPMRPQLSTRALQSPDIPSPGDYTEMPSNTIRNLHPSTRTPQQETHDDPISHRFPRRKGKKGSKCKASSTPRNRDETPSLRCGNCLVRGRIIP